MFVEKEDYYIISEFYKYNVIAAMSKKKLGNMANYIGDIEKATLNRNKFKKLLNLEDKKIVFSKQNHTNNIKYISSEDDLENIINIENIDGFVTNRKDLVIYTFYADCLPIYIYDLKNNAIGIAHSGWQGTYNEILKNLIYEMKKRYDSNNNDLILALGIGINVEEYEVQIDFYNKFKIKFPNEYENIFIFKEGKIFFDNSKLNYLLAIKYGIKKENIIVDNRKIKTAEIFSHRLDKENIGRSSALICLGDSRYEK